MLTAILSMGTLTVVLTSFLVLANKKLYVIEDPRIDIVEQLLPNSNCGACGYPGCRQFGTALVKQETKPGECTVCTTEQRQSIADYLGTEVGDVAQRVARLACAGGSNVSRKRATYSGLSTCRAVAKIVGGNKSCQWGCLGLADCESVCEFNAIKMNQHALPVVIEELCTACGDCVEVCPKDLYSIHSIEHRLWTACSNPVAGDDILKDCQVACNACARCAFDSENDLIVMKNNLPVIDYSKNHATSRPIERCPTGSIVWIEADGNIIKGRESIKVYRKEPLRVQSS